MHIETDVSQTVIDVNIKHATFESSLTIVIDLVYKTYKTQSHQIRKRVTRAARV